MSQVSLLDCTLRDGAYLLPDKTFGEEAIRGISQGLADAGIDFIEIGFLQNDGAGEGRTVYGDCREASGFLPKDRKNARFAVLADYSRYAAENLDDRTEGGIDAVRECFFRQERDGALEACRRIKERGYLLFIQPVDILGYTEEELGRLLDRSNALEPYCFSIVDTFGSMYPEDLQRIFALIDGQLAPSIRLGFHSHNNIQLSNALSQELIRMGAGKRDVIIDCSVSGMGRGAGNTPTELIARYLNDRHGHGYDLDRLLDLIDRYIDGLHDHWAWGYSTEFFLAGCAGAHVNNIAYLRAKPGIRYQEVRSILDRLGSQERKRYDYGLLEKAYREILREKTDE